MPADPRCFASHLGLVACEPRKFSEAVSLVRAGLWPMRATAPSTEAEAPDANPYRVVGEGVGLLALSGILQKGPSKFSGTTSTAMARRQVRAMVADEKVQSILLVIDSPGGYVGGTEDLAADVRAANEVKPVTAYIEDEGASAAYWIASQAGKVYANASAFVGSIGVFAVVADLSKAVEAEGVTVHLLTTGPLKGAGAPGTPVTDAMLAQWQGEVDATMSHFTAAVRAGRSMGAKEFGEVATGAVWIASEAKSMGLIDGVRTLDEVVMKMPKPSKPRYRRADAAIRLAELGDA